MCGLLIEDIVCVGVMVVSLAAFDMLYWYQVDIELISNWYGLDIKYPNVDKWMDVVERS